MKVGQFVATLILVLALCQSSCVTGSGSGSDKTDKETEQMYNKIFSSSRFSSTIDPDTTQQWLKQLNAQLEDGGKQENVKKLLAFSKIQPDCNLSDGSGNVLVANYQFFAQHSTPTIKAYISNCMTRMYEQCRETFVLDTKEAVNRLKNDPNFDRMSRFKELADKEFQESAGFKQDPSEPMRQLILEQTKGKLPAGILEFEVLFRQSVGDLCATIRRELEMMMYFDVLLTPQQVRALGEPITDWYKVRDVCKEVVNEQQAMYKVFRHMKAKFKKEYVTIVSRYERIFERHLWSLKPEQTLEWLLWLDEKLAPWRDENLMKEKVVELANITRRIQQCDLAAAGPLKEKLGEQQGYVEREYNSLTLKRYQKYLRDMMFNRCQAKFVARMEKIEGIVQETLPPERAEKVFRLKKWVAEKIDPAGDKLNEIPDVMLDIVEQETGAPFSPETDRVKLWGPIEKFIVEPCDDIRLYLHIFDIADYVFRRKLARQMDPALRVWFFTSSVCDIAHTAATLTQVQERLLARGKRQPSSG